MKAVVGSLSALAVIVAFGMSSVAGQAATPGSTASREKAASANPGGSATGATRAAEPKYCFLSDITGSRIVKKDCRTRQEWQKLGVKVPNEIAR